MASWGGYTTFTGRLGFLYRTLESLVQSRSIPAMWLATKDFDEIWNSLVQSITSKDAYYTYSARFLHTAIGSTDIHRPILSTIEESSPLQDAYTKTLSSVLATLTAITILR